MSLGWAAFSGAVAAGLAFCLYLMLTEGKDEIKRR